MVTLQELSATTAGTGCWTVCKYKVKVTEIQPGMLLYRPEHKSGVLAAIKGYNERRGRKQGYRRPTRPRKRGENLFRKSRFCA